MIKIISFLFVFLIVINITWGVPLTTQNPTELFRNSKIYCLNYLDSLKYSDTLTVTKTPNELEPDSTVSLQSFETDQAPVPINLSEIRSNLKYPLEAVRDSIEGKVYIKILIDEYGNVIKQGEIRGSDIFFSTVLENIFDLKFSPAIYNNKIVKCWITVPFNFKLNK